MQRPHPLMILTTITIVELHKSIIWGPCHALVIYSLRSVHTHAYSCPHRNKFKKPGMPGLKINTINTFTIE